MNYDTRLNEKVDLERVGRIRIGDYAWAGHSSMIIGNVDVGEGAVIAAAAVVTKDVPPFCVVAGNPARLVKKLPFPAEMREKLGEEAYRKKMLPLIETLGSHWTFLGVVSESEKAAFFHACRLLVLPSINSTESFGMVQVEAMSCGTPVIATDLPGVRQPVKQFGMGCIVPPKNSEALAAAIISLFKELKPKLDIEVIIKHYAPETIVKQYEDIFADLINSN